MMPHNGWHQVAFDRDIPEGLSEVAVAGKPIAVVRAGADIRAYDATCPHRGANLCRGGRLEAGAIRCPFHGLSVALSDRATSPLQAAVVPTLSVGGLLFVRSPDGDDGAFPAVLAELDAGAYFVPGFVLEMSVSAELVIENAFDALHFQPVHAVGRCPDLRVVEEGGRLAVEGRFALPPSPWQTGATGRRYVDVPYRATAYSPTIVVTQMGGNAPYTMITATNPVSDRACKVFLSLVVPSGRDGMPPLPSACRYLLDGAKRGLLEDAPIWEGLATDPPFLVLAGDEPVVAFRRFCQRFR